MPQWRIYCPFCAGTEMKVAHVPTPEEIAIKLSADGLPPDAVPLAT